MPALSKIPINYKSLAGGVFLIGALLRLALYVANPPGNAFDNHFDPIFLILKLGDIPLKNACWECNQPPIFYVLSAIIGKLFLGFGIGNEQILKALQIIPCLFDIATLPVIYAILKQFPISDFSRLFTFGTVCFLPRHIYMAAIHSNDAMTYFAIALFIYLLFDIENLFRKRRIVTATTIAVIAIFTKYTALILIPASIFFLGIAFYKNILPRRIAPLLMIISIPLLLFSLYVRSNIEDYGKALPDGIELRHANLHQPPGEGNISYLSFKPWTMIGKPIIYPENIGSFWTLVYGEMWFDMEPKFLYYTDYDEHFWNDYFQYLAKENNPFPANISLSGWTRFMGSSVIILGLLPVTLIIISGWKNIPDSKNITPEILPLHSIKIKTLIILFLCNAVGIILFTMKYPFFSHMKASFLLNSIPAYAVFLGLGLSSLEKYKTLKQVTTVLLVALYVLVTLHIVQIVIALAGIR